MMDCRLWPGGALPCRRQISNLRKEKMPWNYRVMNRGGELAIYEVYYKDDGT